MFIQLDFTYIKGNPYHPIIVDTNFVRALECDTAYGTSGHTEMFIHSFVNLYEYFGQNGFLELARCISLGEWGPPDWQEKLKVHYPDQYEKVLKYMVLI